MDAPTPRRRRGLWFAVIIVIVVAAGGAVALALNHRSTDSGVTACQAIATRMIGTDNGHPWPLNKDARADFAGSRFADVRSAGTAMADFLNDPSHTDFEAPDLQDTVISDYTNLSHACGNHGVTMPPLGFPGD
jgi:hypothetical protein